MAYLFVYGTLKRAFRNRFAVRLAREATFLGPARTPGRLYSLGAYPALRPARAPGEWVIGELYRLRDPVRTLAALDDYETTEYRRVLRMVTLAGGDIRRSWIYLYGKPLPEQRRILSGEWPENAC